MKKQSNPNPPPIKSKPPATHGPSRKKGLKMKKEYIPNKFQKCICKWKLDKPYSVSLIKIKDDPNCPDCHPIEEDKKHKLIMEAWNLLTKNKEVVFASIEAGKPKSRLMFSDFYDAVKPLTREIPSLKD